ncbi:MAG: LLM class F420-dependent oxidoreductase [SAR202 cluster bacterium]|nr:LLM class F420-dependent oxidoreductase [SAR202 cluster bacterium]
MKIGIAPILTSYSIDVADLAKRAEGLGFESLWLPDQPVLPVKTASNAPRLWGDAVDPLIALARASLVTTTLMLGTAVIVVTERHPIALAKEAATLDAYSGGRLLLGIGTGSIEEEAAILGSDFPHRWTQAREAVLAMKALWTNDESEFHGKYYDFPSVYCFPKPVRKPHPPVLLGGKAANVFKRAVEYGDGWIPIGVTPEEVRAGRAELDRLATAAGRDPLTLEISVVGLKADGAMIEAYRQAGMARAIVSFPTAGKAESMAELEKIARELLP